MIHTPEPKTQNRDRIRLAQKWDAQKMLAEFEALKFGAFEYYSVIALRSPAHMVDPTLPFPQPTGDYADGSWTDWLDTPALKQSPYISSIVDFFKENTKVTLVRLLRLAPKAVVKEHTDPTLALEIERSVIRLTFPIQINDKVEFLLNGTPVWMEPGECWYLKLIDPHKVINDGDQERVNLTIDMIPNEWVRKLILEESFQ